MSQECPTIVESVATKHIYHAYSWYKLHPSPEKFLTGSGVLFVPVSLFKKKIEFFSRSV
jgi:hypothetical protein